VRIERLPSFGAAPTALTAHKEEVPESPQIPGDPRERSVRVGDPLAHATRVVSVRATDKRLVGADVGCCRWSQPRPGRNLLGRCLVFAEREETAGRRRPVSDGTKVPAGPGPGCQDRRMTPATSGEPATRTSRQATRCRLPDAPVSELRIQVER
jgi:hypothetical protein